MIEGRGNREMSLSEKDLAAIGSYVQHNLPQWFAAMPHPKTWLERDMELRERSIRVEEQLNAQRDLMQQGFDHMEKRLTEQREEMIWRFEQVDKRLSQVDKRLDQVDKRFEQINKRFDQVDKRFESLFTRLTVIMGIGFTMMTVLITVFKFIK